MSRRIREEQPFGSDSFLDVIANIVGILIILIVIVGMKVANQAIETPEPVVAEEVDAAAQAEALIAARQAQIDAQMQNAKAAWDRASLVHRNALSSADELHQLLLRLLRREVNTFSLAHRQAMIADDSAGC